MTETTEAAPKRRSGTGLSGMLLPELKQVAAGLGIKGVGGMRKSQLIDAIKAAQSGQSGSRSSGLSGFDSASSGSNVRGEKLSAARDGKRILQALERAIDGGRAHREGGSIVRSGYAPRACRGTVRSRRSDYKKGAKTSPGGCARTRQLAASPPARIHHLGRSAPACGTTDAGAAARLSARSLAGCHRARGPRRARRS